MASPGCQRRTAPSRSSRASRPIRSASFTSTSPRCTPRRDASTVAVDRTSKFAFAKLHERATRRIAADFLRALVAAVPYRIHTVLTDNGTQFVDRTPSNEESDAAAAAYCAARGEPRVWLVHAFDHACEQHGIEHRTTKPAHPWTNGQVEKINRTLKDATVRRYHYGSHDELRHHLQHFLDAYNHARRLKTLRGLTPHEFICKT